MGDTDVETALAPLYEKIAALEVEETPLPTKERRLITIVFTDVVGSTALAAELDPEEWRQTVVGLHSTVGNIISQHQGTVAQYLGDGVLAFFGAQASSEQNAENAIRAALDFQHRVGQFCESMIQNCPHLNRPCNFALAFTPVSSSSASSAQIRTKNLSPPAV